MPDKLTPSQRSYCMSRIRGKDTKPEILVRRGAAGAGIQVQAAGAEAAGKAGYRAAEVWSRDNGERMLLAWT